MTTLSRHATTSSANTLRLSTASTLEKMCMLPKASTASMMKTACTAPRASTASMPRRPHSSRRVTMNPLPKRATTNRFPRMATGLGTTMSSLPQGQLAAYVMQDANEPLATKGLRPHTPYKATMSPLPQRATGL